jgi:hypothetical protein
VCGGEGGGGGGASGTNVLDVDACKIKGRCSARNVVIRRNELSKLGKGVLGWHTLLQGLNHIGVILQE